MAIFDETYRVVGVESQRLILRGLDTGELLTVINADPRDSAYGKKTTRLEK